jgi:hypothetical protein
LDAYNRAAAVFVFPDKHIENIACSTQISISQSLYLLYISPLKKQRACNAQNRNMLEEECIGKRIGSGKLLKEEIDAWQKKANQLKKKNQFELYKKSCIQIIKPSLCCIIKLS